jgi:hypothetical protein
MGAIRTDLILSTEIMLIGLSNVDPDLDFWLRLAVLAVIALSMTALVYGAVALLVKIDDIGLKMAKSGSVRVRHTGARIVRSMPAVFRVISIVGTVAMLWVGGHLVLANLGEVGWHAPVELLHAVEHALEPSGPWWSWIGDTAVSAVAGLCVGSRDRRHRADHRQGVRSQPELQRGAPRAPRRDRLTAAGPRPSDHFRPEKSSARWFLTADVVSPDGFCVWRPRQSSVTTARAVRVP